VVQSSAEEEVVLLCSRLEEKSADLIVCDEIDQVSVLFVEGFEVLGHFRDLSGGVRNLLTQHFSSSASD
jgi:hypothetical protein